MDTDCLESQANDEFVFYTGYAVTESNANVKYSQRSRVSNLRPIPTTLTSHRRQQCDCAGEPPIIVGSARSISPALPQEVIELLPVGLRSLSPSAARMANKKVFHRGHSRKLSHNYDYLHDLVTCDAIQVLSSRPSPLPPITRCALSSVRDCYRSNVSCDSYCEGERSGESSTTNSLSSTSAMSVDSSNHSAASCDRHAGYNRDDESVVPNEFDDYDNFTTSADITSSSMGQEPHTSGYVLDNDYSNDCLHSNLNDRPESIATPNANGGGSSHRLGAVDDYDFSSQSDDLILRECKDFINDNSPELLSSSDSTEQLSSTDEEDQATVYIPSAHQYDEFNCNSIYDNVEISHRNPRNGFVLSTNLSTQPAGRPPCSPLKSRRSPSPRRRVDSSSLRRRDIPRKAAKPKTTQKTSSVRENRTVENVFPPKHRDPRAPVPNDDDTKKEKVKNKSIYHYVKKLLA